MDEYAKGEVPMMRVFVRAISKRIQGFSLQRNTRLKTFPHPPMPAPGNPLRLPWVDLRLILAGFSEVLVRELNFLGEALRKRDADLREHDRRLKDAVEDLKAEQDRRGSARQRAVSQDVIFSPILQTDVAVRIFSRFHFLPPRLSGERRSNTGWRSRKSD